MSFRDEGGEAVEQKIRWTERAGRTRSRCGGTGYLEEGAGRGQTSGKQCSSPRVEVGLACKLGGEPLEVLGSFQQQWGCSGPHARRERDLTLQQLDMRHLQLVWRG